MFLKLVPHLPVVMDLGLRSGCAQWYNQMFYIHWHPIFLIIQYIIYMAKGIFVHKVHITFYCCERWQIMLYTYAFSSIELSISFNNTDDSTEWIIVMRYKSCMIRNNKDFRNNAKRFRNTWRNCFRSILFLSKRNLFQRCFMWWLLLILSPQWPLRRHDLLSGKPYNISIQTRCHDELNMGEWYGQTPWARLQTSVILTIDVEIWQKKLDR